MASVVRVQGLVSAGAREGGGGRYRCADDCSRVPLRPPDVARSWAWPARFQRRGVFVGACLPATVQRKAAVQSSR
eukprot:COSAG01_NODE_2573_length_7434_cov_7.930207_4_plen_75_part_00